MTCIVTSTYRYKRPPRGMSGDNLDGLSAAVTAWAVGERLVRRIYLFGSRAKGTARPDSDIDLAILHDIDPEVASTCHPPEDAHMWTWMVHSERWIAELQSRVGQVHVQQVDRESRKIVVPALKECRLCLYRRVSMLLIAAWLATVGQAFGFEVDGYRSGVTRRGSASRRPTVSYYPEQRDLCDDDTIRTRRPLIHFLRRKACHVRADLTWRVPRI